jgi:hypothetical protein
VIAIAGVVVLAVAGLVVAVLSATVARHPNRGAMLVVLGAAAGGMFGFLLAAMTLLAVGLRGGEGGARAPAAVQYAPPRLAGGLVAAVALLLTAAWLIRSGDWRRPDD